MKQLTEEETNQIVWQSIKNNDPPGILAQHLECSVEEAKQKQERLVYSQELRIIELLSRGLNKRAVASVLGCTEEMIDRILDNFYTQSKRELFEEPPERLTIFEIKRLENMATTAFRQFAQETDTKVKAQYLQLSLTALKEKQALMQKMGVLPK